MTEPTTGFNVQKFMGEKWLPREQDVRIPELAPFFPEDAEPVFRVRGLTGTELANVQEAAQRNRDVAALVEGVLSPDNAERIAALRDVMGIGDKVPDELAKRMAMVEAGCVSPRLDMPTVVQLFRVLPVDMYNLANTISSLTGAGHVPGKAQPSGDATT